jgi:uncharacterized protein (UPF0262 family)
MKLVLRMALVMLAALSASVVSATELTPHRAEYKVRIAVVTGQLNTELKATDDGYVATHIVKPTGLSRVVASGEMFVTSTFTPVADGVRPVSYRAIDTIRGEPEANITFDWSANVAKGTVGEVPVEFQLEGRSHDAVSIQYELMYDLINRQSSESYVLFDVEKMRVAHIREVGNTSIKTKAGTYDVVGIQHQKEGSSRVTTLWCAPELDYLPVMIEQHRKDKLKFRATLTSYTPEPIPDRTPDATTTQADRLR